MKISVKPYLITIVFLCEFLILLTSGCKKKILLLDEYPTIRFEHQNINISQTLNTIYFINENIGFIGGNNGTLFKHHNNNWVNISSNTSYHIYSIWFNTEEIGFLGTNLGLLKTIDGGLTWTASIGAGVFMDLFFLNTNIGFAAGYKWNSGNNEGAIYKTIDGGTTWYELTLVSGWSTPGLSAVHFVDENNGFVVGENLTNMKTTDGGITWTGYYNGTNTDINYTDICYINPSIGYRTGQNGTLQEISTTSYNDLNWNIKYDIYAIDFHGQNGLAVGENCVFGYVSELSDDGSWSYLLTPKGKSFNQTYNDIKFLNSNIAYAVGNNGIVTKFYYR